MSASVHAGISPLEQTRHPLEQTTPPPGTDPPPGSRHPLGADPLPPSRLKHTVKERPIRILLECILVLKKVLSQWVIFSAHFPSVVSGIECSSPLNTTDGIRELRLSLGHGFNSCMKNHGEYYIFGRMLQFSVAAIMVMVSCFGTVFDHMTRKSRTVTQQKLYSPLMKNVTFVMVFDSV